MLNYSLTARRNENAASRATAHEATVELDTSLAGRQDAFNPVEMLLAALAACIIKGIERSAPLIGFEFQSVDVALQALRQDSPPQLVSIVYELTIDTQETERRLELLHTNLRKYGTISNTLAIAVNLTGTIKRKSEADHNGQ